MVGLFWMQFNTVCPIVLGCWCLTYAWLQCDWRTFRELSSLTQRWFSIAKRVICILGMLWFYRVIQYKMVNMKDNITVLTELLINAHGREHEVAKMVYEQLSSQMPQPTPLVDQVFVQVNDQIAPVLPMLCEKIIQYFASRKLSIGGTFMVRAFQKNFVATLTPEEYAEVESAMLYLVDKGIFDETMSLTQIGYDKLYSQDV